MTGRDGRSALRQQWRRHRQQEAKKGERGELFGLTANADRHRYHSPSDYLSRVTPMAARVANKRPLMNHRILAVLVCASIFNAESVAESPEDTFAYFVGHWKCEGVFPASGKSIASSLTFERDASSGALLKHHDDVPPAAYHALELWGFVKSGGLSDTIMDTYSGVRSFSSPGWSGDTLMWSSAPAIRPAQRFTYVRLSADMMRVDWSVAKADGAFQVGDTLTCVRSQKGG
jgi:hypothetical protein